MPAWVIPAIGAGLSALSGVLSNDSNERMSRDQLDQQAQLTREQLAQQLAIANAGRDQDYRRTALDAAQMDPLKQQKSRQLNALVASLLSGYKPSTMGDAGSGLQLK